MKSLLLLALLVATPGFCSCQPLAQVQQRRLGLLETSAQVLTVAFSPDSRMLASGGFDKAVVLWEVASGKERASLAGHTDVISSVSFCSDGKTVASGSWDTTVKLWDAFSSTEKATLKGHAGRV